MLDNLKSKKGLTLLLIFFLSLFFLWNIFEESITGWASNTFSVSIRLRTKIRTTAFDYPVYPEIGNITNITIEIQNSGSTTYDERIEVFIKNSTLDQLAYYYDALTELRPGDRKSFKVIYLPPDYGVYYIQLRVSYADTKRMETWGTFIVRQSETSNQTTGTQGVTEQTTQSGVSSTEYYVSESDAIKGRAGAIRVKYYEHKLSIDAPNELNIPKGETIVTYIKLNNIGNSTLHSLKITIYTDKIEADIFPKILTTFPPNKSSIFMLSVKVPFDTKPDIYPLDIEFSSNEIQVARKIIVNVSDIKLKDMVYQIITNYKFIIAEFENEISDAMSNGIRVSEIQSKLEIIKLDLDLAEEYYNTEKYHDAYQKLQEIRFDLQDLMMSFAVINIPKLVFLKASNVIKLLGFLVLVLALVLLYMFKKSKEKLKRPKILRESQESGQTV